MKKSLIKYKDWKTGEKREYELSSSHPSENPSGLFCPFDNTEIIRWYDHMGKGYECPNCGMDYSAMNGKNQEEVNRVAKEHFKKLEKELLKLDLKISEMTLTLTHAQKQGLFGKK